MFLNTYFQFLSAYIKHLLFSLVLQKDSIQVIVLYNQQLRDRKVLKVRPSCLLLKVENTSKLQYHETLLSY